LASIERARIWNRAKSASVRGNTASSILFA
jgi:hypothetical protein